MEVCLIINFGWKNSWKKREREIFLFGRTRGLVATNHELKNLKQQTVFHRFSIYKMDSAAIICIRTQLVDDFKAEKQTKQSAADTIYRIRTSPYFLFPSSLALYSIILRALFVWCSQLRFGGVAAFVRLRHHHLRAIRAKFDGIVRK